MGLVSEQQRKESWETQHEWAECTVPLSRGSHRQVIDTFPACGIEKTNCLAADPQPAGLAEKKSSVLGSQSKPYFCQTLGLLLEAALF